MEIKTSAFYWSGQELDDFLGKKLAAGLWSISLLISQETLPQKERRQVTELNMLITDLIGK